MRELTRKQRQMLNNFEAWLLAHDAPMVEFLPEEYDPIREDRILFFDGPGWTRYLRRKDLFIQSHEHIKKHRPLGGTCKTARHGYRGLATFAAPQVILHFDLLMGYFLEWDFDLGNPAALKIAFLRESKRDLWHMIKGVGGIMLHLGEYVGYRSPQLVGKSMAGTNPFVVRKWLKRQGMEARKA